MAAAPLTWPIARVRQEFVDFFVKKKGHTFVAGSPVVPHNDPTLLFINAGMNQFKALFLGTADPNTDFGRLTRAANSQICIRAGGKHNDLDDVGRDTYHHTFFEMLGSWSFGSYFKREAIQWAWELLTEVYQLPKDRLYVTYFEGDPANGIACDDESRDIWRELVAEDHIIKGNVKDNFWEMGETGPCGPCTEIHFDRIGGRNAAHLVNHDDPMVLEIWNLVFMQFERVPGGKLVPLPQPHVDTGMGLERIASILQDVTSNYDSDAWTPIFAAIQQVTKFPTPYDSNKDKDDATVAYRVVADHIRCLTVALADGAVPDSVGRGFVLRRIIRRAIRYGNQFLNAETGFFTQLVDVVVASLGPFFTHLQDPKTLLRVKSILTDEEESFARTWKIGLKHFDNAKQGVKVISGVDAFVLHDRYGFPVDLTCLLAEKEGMSVDMEGFNTEMKNNQVSAGRVAAAKTFLDTFQLDTLKTDGIPLTNDNVKYVWEDTQATVLAVLHKAAGKFVPSITAEVRGEDAVGVILDVSSFYSESGGQIYDTGVLEAVNGGSAFDVQKVLAFGGYVAHIGCVKTGTISVGDRVALKVNYARRLPIATNHTTTHQLNWALRQALEREKPDSFMEVNQKGSLVNEEMLRFDFSYNTKLSNEEILRVEALLNEAVAKNLLVDSREVPLEVAKSIYGLRPMFGEKYPDPVNVVSIGKTMDEVLANPQSEDLAGYSIEFCGGTHVKSLGEVQRGVIVSEDALMKGVRRIVMLTRDAARASIALGDGIAAEYAAIMAGDEASFSDATVKTLSVLNKKVGDSNIPLTQKNKLRDDIDNSIKTLMAKLKQRAGVLKATATKCGATLAEGHKEGDKFLVTSIDTFGADREMVQAVMDGFLSVKPEVGLFVIGVDVANNKALAIASLPASFVAKKLNAVEWAKSVGKGGGKPNAAQAGIAGVSAVEGALAAASAFAKTMEASL